MPLMQNLKTGQRFDNDKVSLVICACDMVNEKVRI